MTATDKGKLTQRQTEFVKGLTSGLNQTEAARQAGYSHPDVQAVRLARHPAVRAAVAENVTWILQSGAETAAQFMVGALADKSLPEETRHKCAVWVLEAAGSGPASKPLEDWEDLLNKSASELAYAQLVVSAQVTRQQLDHLQTIEIGSRSEGSND